MNAEPNTVQLSSQTHDFVIPRVVAESMRRILIHRRMDSATTLRSAQNDNLVHLRGNDGLKCLI